MRVYVEAGQASQARLWSCSVRLNFRLVDVQMSTGETRGQAQPWLVAGDIDGFFGLAIDNEKALRWHRQAAEGGNGYAQCYLGCANE